VAASQRVDGAVFRIDSPAGKSVVAAEELHGLVPPDHPHLERLRGARRRLAHDDDGGGGPGIDGRGGR
jgi:hypothetical protein